jgi:hypothetical protein
MSTDALRLHAAPWDLVRRTAGSPRLLLRKLAGLLGALRGYGSRARVEPRLARLRELGLVDEIPTRMQRFVGAVDMLRFFIVPCAADYYRRKGIDFRFHTLLRFLDDPASLVDPTGFNSTRDAIIGHVMQVVHANPRYDLELLASFPDGLAQLEEQVVAVMDGTHARTESIRAIVEDPAYHPRLLEYVRAYRANPLAAQELLRENIGEVPEFARAERVFGSLTTAMAYFCRLPRRLGPGLWHLVTVRALPAAEV